MTKRAPSKRLSTRPRGRPPAATKADLGVVQVEAAGTQIAQRVGEGTSLVEACADFRDVTPSQFLRWVDLHPKLREAWSRAKGARANTAFFEGVVALAQEIRTVGEASKVESNKIKCLTEAADLFKWAAARLDPGAFGDRATPGSGVAIQINTSLPLLGANVVDDGADSWTVRVGPGPAPETRASEGSGALPVKTAADPIPLPPPAESEWEPA